MIDHCFHKLLHHCACVVCLSFGSSGESWNALTFRMMFFFFSKPYLEMCFKWPVYSGMRHLTTNQSLITYHTIDWLSKTIMYNHSSYHDIFFTTNESIIIYPTIYYTTPLLIPLLVSISMVPLLTIRCDEYHAESRCFDAWTVFFLVWGTVRTHLFTDGHFLGGDSREKCW